jgi:hypothetical protein
MINKIITIYAIIDDPSGWPPAYTPCAPVPYEGKPSLPWLTPRCATAQDSTRLNSPIKSHRA